MLRGEAQAFMDLILNRPAKKNALTDEMYLALVAGLQKARGDDDVHVVVLRGEGDCFCAGNDLQAFRNRGPASGPSPGGPATTPSSPGSTPPSIASQDAMPVCSPAILS